MTKEALLKAITKGKLFKSIDQAQDLDFFIGERINHHIKVYDDPEFKEKQREREGMEAEFITLYGDPETGKKKVSTYGAIIDAQIAIMERAMFKAGFAEGVALILAIME